MSNQSHLNKMDSKISEDTVMCTSLGPNDFFTKQMNIPKEALANIFDTWKSALKNFLQSNYTCYDALVGENACHIRAFVINDISELKNNNHEFFLTLKKTILELSQVISGINKATIVSQDQNNSIEIFLKKNKLIFNIPINFFFQIKYIIDSYLLTLTKVSLTSTELTLKEKTSYQPIRNLGFAYNRSQYLIHNTQKNLSASSCDYIISEANFLQKNGIDQLLVIKNDSHGRSLIPQFFTAKVLLKRALQKKHHLIFKITRYLKKKPFDSIILQFRPNFEQNDFEICYSSLSSTSIVIIEGVVNYESPHESIEEYKKRFLSQSTMIILLANFAAHPQYSGNLKHLSLPFNEAITTLRKDTRPYFDCNEKIIEDIKLEEKDFIYHKNYAQHEGCSLDNPALLFINHMYCDFSYKYSPYFNKGLETKNHQVTIE